MSTSGKTTLIPILSLVLVVVSVAVAIGVFGLLVKVFGTH
jgi:hypothetical protein